ncbi:succinate-semialdehyde dehydrogenase/glutarate-semialdehyde dehydrogenase [Plasticicumulans lactativorans]|uniref:Succinate-semialdehyde dehydrogenase/glutarate-semialdehyde dehydrogenase n=1 Tax=Plasticicumulans lactativorans TaxID=1133106 RepID=A0A4V2SCS6_9GAMM|nr:NAD-dependent succinate-semialdehyde dehydrogenase [Plasticicumulans lactativorans]TCO80560.1 succinate-semialdehyde dehydrogenase/glutarate-semialdehyde dehydrogenase [Plasticicumulans lactativorans]
MFASTNPTTGETIARFDEHTDEYVDAALQSAADAQQAWARRPLAERAALLGEIATVFRNRKDEFARLISMEMGKPIREAVAEIEKCAWTLDFYAEVAPRHLADMPVASNATESKVVFDPLGVVLAIMPWNYPFWQFVRFAAPALAAGNGTILKHANNVPQCALALEQAFLQAGTPDGLVRSLLVDSSRVHRLIDDPRIAALTLTGSTAVGKIVASQAGRAMKKQVLELGGSDPFIVLADADIELAAKTAAKARFSNAGQSCICSKRFLVEESVADRFVERFCKHVKEIRVGDPFEAGVTMGPMARENLRDELHCQVERSLAAGAKLLMGGKPLEGGGAFYAPTVIDHVTPDMAIGCEETFGPVAAVIRVPDAEEAVRLANATEFGLGASLWTSDLDLAGLLVRRIEAGAVFVNGLVASDARLPFGGIKQSGYGRELGEFGIREFTNIKTVWIGPAR